MYTLASKCSVAVFVYYLNLYLGIERRQMGILFKILASSLEK